MRIFERGLRWAHAAMVYALIDSQSDVARVLKDDNLLHLPVQLLETLFVPLLPFSSYSLAITPGSSVRYRTGCSGDNSGFSCSNPEVLRTLQSQFNSK